MSTAFFVMTVLLGSSLVMAFVLHPSEEEPVTPASSPVIRHNRCQGESLQSIRKGLLGALNLQTEPRLPVGGLTSIREQWKDTFNGISNTVKDTTVPALSGYSVTPGAVNSTGMECCQMASEIFLKDLDWDSWVIYPESLTFVQCASCNPLLAVNTLRCPSYPPNVQETPSQMPCCQPTSQEMVPILYMDEFSTVVISSVQLTRTCGCGPGNLQLPNEE
ncbi:gonadal somatic cell derived factor [Centroberyx affinis]|uniref:gonadal somatic cell derived factor n=1 Tax=Centroberyx affinis TaxID=166261 RepID=UPI003A5BF270